MYRYHLVASFIKEQHAFEYQIIPEISTIKVLLPMQTSNDKRTAKSKYLSIREWI